MNRLQLIEQHYASTVLFRVTATTLYIQFNRPDKLNSLTAQMTQANYEAMKLFPTHEIVFISTGDKAIASGGDLTPLLEDCGLIVPLITPIAKAVLHLAGRTAHRMVVMKGFVIGAGCALASQYDVRVATDSTRWFMPENSIGTSVDNAVTYVLSSQVSEGVGLYLTLTGRDINGAEVYALGLATHYVPDSFTQELLALTAQLSVLEAADHMHQTPPIAQCSILQLLPDIQACFAGASSVEEIFSRLAGYGNEWARETLELLCLQCPLSLVVSFRTYQLSKTSTLKESLQRDFNISMQLFIVKNSNFLTGWRHKMVNRLKTRPDWRPNQLAEVHQSLIADIFANAEGPRPDFD
jgi:enoyl-CoA hydratase/carnithine racemase